MRSGRVLSDHWDRPSPAPSNVHAVQGLFADLGHCCRVAGAAATARVCKSVTSWPSPAARVPFMRHVSSAGLRAGLIAVIVAVPVQAAAQSFLQNLFGLGQPSSRRELPATRPGAPAFSNSASGSARPDMRWGREIRRYSPSASEDARSDSSEDDAQIQSRAGGGKYRTLCVRTCDGYYFPIGNAVSRNRFMRDAAQCRASCGEDGRLFYLPSGSDNVSTMLDLAGRSYVRMPTAFKYRKSLTDGCTCRPMPWSAAEQQRHQRYAEEAARVLAEAEAKRLAAEAAKPAQELAPVANTKQATAAGQVPVESAEATRSASAAVDGDAEAPAANVAAVADQVVPKPAERAERIRQASAIRPASNRGPDRAPTARRQQAVARAPAPQGGGSWFAPSSAKYTWPGDAPRR